ncbi:MAG TPA: hypothetical protein VFE90_22260 [Myxococcales bacterium]|nr:hypothetical protein [Myxococcales bacterium]
MNKMVLAAALLAAPLAARADLGLRGGLEANIATHSNGSTQVLTDNWPLAGDLMLSYWTPGSILSIDAEISRQFFANPPVGQTGGIAWVFRPGIRLSPPVLPIYARAALPINIDSNNPRETVDLRLGVGLTIPLVLFKIYIEADADFPLSSESTANISAFSGYSVWLASGIDFRF